MGHLPPLISDLALILITAAIVTLIFKKIRQPLVLGYIIAGFLVGPHLGIFPSVADSVNVKTLAEIGVIFLLFSLGLEFSFKKLMRVGGSASITAIFEIIFITIVGFFTGKLLGWSTMDCLFLGGMLASSSTTIIIRAFDELGIKTKSFARIVFGVLVVEDIVVILLMVLLSTISVTQQVESTEMILTILKLAFFLVLWFVLGIFLIPSVLKKVRNLLSNEVYLILSIGLCLGMVVFATKVGFSAELGAFIMGSILAETTSAERIEHIFQSVKDLFGAIFFVSVGMMIDPSILLEYGWVVLIITLSTIFGKFFSTTIGAVLSGQTLNQAIHVGMSMAQIGEFAFIVATLGMTLGVISDFLFPVAVAASAITTFTTPYMIKYSDKMAKLVERILPKKLVNRIDLYASRTQHIKTETEWKIYVRKYTTTVLLNGFILLAILIFSTRFVLPILLNAFENFIWGRIIFTVIILLISSPFLWALMLKSPTKKSKRELWRGDEFSNGPFLVLEILRLLIGIVMIGYLFWNAFSTIIAMLISIPIVIAFIFIFSKLMKKQYERIESRFVDNLNSREIAEAQKNAPMNTIRNKIDPNADEARMAAWDVSLVDLHVPQTAKYIGRTLKELNWREQYGVNIVYIKREEKIYFSPNPDSILLPLDHIGVFTDEEKLKSFNTVFYTESTETYSLDTDIDDIVVARIVVEEKDRINGLAIRNSAIRERTGGIVVGIERGDEKILSPSANTIFTENDVVWIVGKKKKLKELKSKH